MENIILKDTSLCAIVRDEMMNPAGGIIDFVDSTMPFLEAGVIVDTGSVDGTREALEELSSRYTNLVILDRLFDDYASSRNYALDNVKTKMAFVLDADERLMQKEFEILKSRIEKMPLINGRLGYVFNFMRRYSKKNDCISLSCYMTSLNNPRLFLATKKLRYKNTLNIFHEMLFYYGHILNKSTRRDQRLVLSWCWIDHYRTTHEAEDERSLKWYGDVVYEGKAHKISPSQVVGCENWRKLNPNREGRR